jgi:ribonuclease-3
LAELEAALGHGFAQPALLKEALTHASLAGGRQGTTRTNERLEFLGDRVLGLTIAHALVERFPGEAEGGLTPRLVALVRRESLAEVAQALELGRWLRVAASRASLDRPGPGMLADCCEAIIGAVYLDGGFPAARDFVLRHWAPLMADAAVLRRDAKSTLKEWADARGPEAPVYRVVEQSGPDHATTFTVEVSVSGHPPQAATAGTKRAAEQAAAAKLLQALGQAAHVGA